MNDVCTVKIVSLCTNITYSRIVSLVGRNNIIIINKINRRHILPNVRLIYTNIMTVCFFSIFHVFITNGRYLGWGVICGDGFGVLEALVVCRSVGLGYAAAAFQTDQFGGLDLPVVLSGVECAGNESSLAGCYHQQKATCSTRKETVAAVVCVRGEWRSLVLSCVKSYRQRCVILSSTVLKYIAKRNLFNLVEHAAVTVM